ncbi:MAG: hypothetical protein JST80_00580 [Bdellovibrionales bacterium]|nr:hypothetical protein [Bdellovibrionales bacterium]
MKQLRNSSRIDDRRSVKILAKYKVIKFFAFGVLFLGLTSQTLAITPQKYCESLAATSCELLNVDVTSGSVANSSGTGIILPPFGVFFNV